ncbi:DUF833-domain-containing protein [Lichtheimia hyalospora FSU 10163]|nr:DUF833-domain-containing protein [Lichtheimia hyalospora FSU 10163]
MCILFWTVNSNPKYRFIFAGNRDEFLDRPTAAAHFWPSPHEHILAGTDLEAGATPSHDGTWLGITRKGRFAALTNYREKKYLGRRSRGALTRDFLQGGNNSAIEYMKNLEEHASEYGGFSLICMNLKGDHHDDMAYFSNREGVGITPLSQGEVYGLSNSVLDNPWEKVDNGRAIFRDIVNQSHLSEEQLIESLFDLLRTTTDDCGSPTMDINRDSAVALEMAKKRIFIPLFSFGTSIYGTRTSTVILVDHQGNTTFIERDHYIADEQGQRGDNDQKVAYKPVVDHGRTFHFNIDS